MVDVGFITNKCLEFMEIDAIPDNIVLKFLDSVEFYNLTKDGIPEEYALSIPVLSTVKDSKIYIYTNITELQEKECYVSELFVFQLIKAIVETNPVYAEFQSKVKNTFLYKNVEEGVDALFEFSELAETMDVMKIIYSEEVGDEDNPYSGKHRRKVGLKMLSRAKSKTGNDKISTFLYAIARLCEGEKIYNFHNVMEFRTANLLWELSEILLSVTIDTATVQDLNKIGSICKNLMKS